MNETIEQLRRVLQEMWHRRWIGLAAAWVVALVAITVTFRIPEQFEASARVYVDTDSILQPLLSGLAVHPNVEQQVAALSRTLINRPNVEKVVRSVDLDIRARNDAERGEIVDRVMKAIKMSNAGNNLYFISYYDPNPEQGRRVVQALLTIFMESSLGDKRQDTRAAVRFLDEQIKHYEGTLSAAENRLKEFKLRYMGVTEKDNYFARVAAIGEQIAQAQLELSSAMQSRDAYKKELAGEQPTYLPLVEQAQDVTVPEIDERLAQLERTLDELSRRFTDSHPDVAGTKRLIADLKAQRQAEVERRRKVQAEAAAKGPRPLDRNPVFQQLRLSLAEAEARVAAARAKLGGLEANQAQLRSQAKLVPQVEAEFAQLNRDYDVQKRTYESLLARRESAAMGITMQDTGGAQFRVIDPPRVSPRPVAPNRLLLLGLALLASLGAGLVASFIASQVAPTFHDARSLRESTKRPVLGLVSILPSPAAARRRRRGAFLFAGGVSSLLAMFAGIAALALTMWRATA